MPLKELFLRYVEMQKCATEARLISNNPTRDPEVTKAYDKANDLKRQVLNEIEKLQNEISNPE